jgi:hypothetical protein
LQPHCARSRFHVSQCRLGSHRVGWVDEHGNTDGSGHQLAQKFQPLCHQLGIKKIDACQLPRTEIELKAGPGARAEVLMARRMF